MGINENTQSLEKLLAAAGGTVHGKKKLHKLAFLCQASGTDLGLEFSFHYYGVYSSTLSNLMKEAKELEVVDFDDSITMGAVPVKLLKRGEVANPVSESGLQLVDALKNRSARALEVLSTIVYLERRGHKDADLRAKLAELKGHLQPYYGEAFALANQYFDIA